MASLTTIASLPPLPTWRLLGEPAIPWRGQDLTPLMGKKAVGLIAYLALAPNGAGRDEVAGRLWPPTETAKELARAKHNLRQCLVMLRKTFGDDYEAVFEDADDWLRLRTETIRIDVARLYEINAEGAAAPVELAEVCRGPFLRGLTTRARPFDGWVEERRGQIAGIAGPLLESARAAAEQAGDRGLAARLGGAMDAIGIGRANLPTTEIRAVEAAAPPRQRRWMRPAAIGLATLAVGFGVGYAVSDSLRNWINGQFGIVELEALGPPRITVLPFATLNDTAEERALANGVTLGVNYALYAISELFPVTAAPVARALDQTELVAKARQLNVRYVISGNVGREGSEVRVDVQCFDAETRTIVWIERFTQQMEQSFKLQDEITLQILKELNIPVNTAELNRIQYLHDTTNLEAWLAATKGVASLIRVTREDVLRAKGFYEQALREDPNYISARRGLAWVVFLSVRLGWASDPTTAIAEARNHLGIVLTKRPNDGTSKSLEGAILLLEQRYDEAIRAGEAAVADLPNSADTNGVFAHTLTYVGEHKRALQYIARAMELSEIQPAWYRWTLGRALRMDGQFEESVKILERDFGKGEPSIVHLTELTASYAAAGRIEDARRIAGLIKGYASGFTATAWLSHPPIKVPEIHAREFEYLSIAGL